MQTELGEQYYHDFIKFLLENQTVFPSDPNIIVDLIFCTTFFEDSPSCDIIKNELPKLQESVIWHLFGKILELQDNAYTDFLALLLLSLSRLPDKRFCGIISHNAIKTSLPPCFLI